MRLILNSSVLCFVNSAKYFYILSKDVFGDSDNITSMILDFVFETKPNSSHSNVSSLIVERESGQDVDGFDDTSFDESDMDLEGLILLKDESRNSTVDANSTLTADLEGSEE